MTSLRRMRWTLDTFETMCGCGARIHMMRNGKIALIAASHRCEYRERQEAVMRTLQAEQDCGCAITPGEVVKRLRSFGLGNTFLPYSLAREMAGRLEERADELDARGEVEKATELRRVAGAKQLELEV